MSEHIEQLSIQSKQVSKIHNKSFEQSVKLTQKITKLSAPIYERVFSPWGRKRNQSIDKKNYCYDQPLPSNQITTDKVNQTTKQNQNALFTQSKMNDFLKKIQFTKRKKSMIQTKYATQNTTKSMENQSVLNSENNCDRQGFCDSEMKKLIIFPKAQKTSNNFSFQQFNKKLKEVKDKNLSITKKQWSEKKINPGVQTFYDPYQNSPKSGKYSTLSKGLIQFCLKLQDQLSKNKSTNLTDFELLPKNLSTSYRKNSLFQKSFRERINGQLQQNLEEQNKVLCHSEQKRLKKKLKRKSFSNRFVTQPSEMTCHQTINPQAYSQIDRQCQITTTPTYATPICQAIKRIKQQSKRMKKLKTQPTSNRQSNSGSFQANRDEDKQFLYKTFLNYKTQKYSNDLNITKTLKIKFHNKKSFKENLQKIWLNSNN